MNSNAPKFFGLPLELRELVYKDVLSEASQGPQLILTCREVYEEARKFLFQRPLTFRSQTALYQWLQGAPSKFLQHVGEVRLELQDVDLTPLLAPTASSSSSQSGPSSPLHTWDVYESEIANLCQALGKFENARTFTLRSLSGRQPHLYLDFLGKFLAMLASVYPDLQDLSLECNFHHQSLAFLRSFKSLKSFSFDGFSASEASEAAEILSSLQLTSISLISQPTTPTPTHRQHGPPISKPQSFDNQVLRTLTHLAAFSVTEHRPSAESPALSLNPKILSSLYIPTLSSLGIILSYTPNDETLVALQTCLKKSEGLESLELYWPDIESDVLETYALLPDTLTWLSIRVMDTASAIAMTSTILEKKELGNARGLRYVVLTRSPREATMSIGDGLESTEQVVSLFPFDSCGL
ncbi:hypothetical protein P280DRAFT_514406 [Massarina eburnea CBS 473.64]|uniref:Uncharacterized protein n=1 Tax=Massarina eburnea CBS 473.64 TaxID=1395130 RepID=A0A6A6SAX9_9PLEO|nr:hypothetical protein P280DRAFT_514406 [Massarina eburnea CBS 473.64]